MEQRAKLESDAMTQANAKITAKNERIKSLQASALLSATNPRLYGRASAVADWLWLIAHSGGERGVMNGRVVQVTRCPVPSRRVPD